MGIPIINAGAVGGLGEEDDCVTRQQAWERYLAGADMFLQCVHDVFAWEEDSDTERVLEMALSDFDSYRAEYIAMMRRCIDIVDSPGFTYPPRHGREMPDYPDLDERTKILVEGVLEDSSPFGIIDAVHEVFLQYLSWSKEVIMRHWSKEELSVFIFVTNACAGSLTGLAGRVGDIFMFEAGDENFKVPLVVPNEDGSNVQIIVRDKRFYPRYTLFSR